MDGMAETWKSKSFVSELPAGWMAVISFDEDALNVHLAMQAVHLVLSTTMFKT